MGYAIVSVHYEKREGIKEKRKEEMKGRREKGREEKQRKEGGGRKEEMGEHLFRGF